MPGSQFPPDRGLTGGGGSKVSVAQLPSLAVRARSTGTSNTLPVFLATSSAQLTSALSSCSSAGGGTIFLAPGTYTGNFTLPPKTIIDGQHPAAAIITQANSANGDVIQGNNFLTLTGKTKATGDYALGAPESGLRNVTVDGNKANNATGYCFRIWGRATIIDNVWFQNGPQGDFWTEFTDVDTFGDVTQKLEGFFYKIKSSNSGGDGWTMRGPHDSICVGMTSFNHAGYMITVDGITSSYLGGLRMYEANSYLNALGCVRQLNSGWVRAYGGTLSGANTGIGFTASATGPACQFIGTQMSGRLTGFDLKGFGHQIFATIANMPPAANSDVVKLDTCNGCHVYLNGNTGDINVGSACNIVNGVVDNINVVSGILNMGLRTNLTAGTINASSRIDLIGYGNSSGTLQQFGTATVKIPAGYTPSFPSSSKTMMAGDSGSSPYSASISPDNSQGALQEITVTNSTAFTINAPTVNMGQLTFVIFNNSGGAMGAITWNATYALAGAFTNPATGKRRTITFYWDSPANKWVELSRAAADI